MRKPGLSALALFAALATAALAQAPPASSPTAAAPPAPEASPAPDASPAPTFPSQVEMVTVDVVVTDKKGTPVTGLTRDDFQVLEEDTPQTIASFDAVTLPATPSATPPEKPRISTNTAREVRVGRSFVILFDDVHLSPGQSLRAKQAVAQFLKAGVREGDNVTLIASGGGAWWSTRMEAGRDELISLLKRFDGRLIPDMSPERMSDYEAMRIHVYHDTQAEERVSRRFETYGVNQGRNASGSGDSDLQSTTGDPFVQARATDVYFQSVSRNRITLQILERVLTSLASTKGRKSVIIVSQGFIYDPNLDEFKTVLKASRRSNAAMYFVDTRGLTGMPVYFGAEFGPSLDSRDIGAAFMDTMQEAEGTESIAEDSGGFSVKNTNDLGKGIQRIADETQSYYLLGYNPTNNTRDGRYRKIQVKLANRKNVQIRARKGYFAPLDAKPTAKKTVEPGDPDIQAALDSPYEVQEVPLRMTSYVFDETLLGKASTLVATDVDLGKFQFQEKDGRFVDTVEFLLVVAHRETGEFFRYDQKVEMNLQPKTRDKLFQTWFPIVRDFELAPGGYQAKIVVRDKNSHRLGTVVHEFEVPDFKDFRVSTPIVSDTLQPSDDNIKQPRPAIVVRRVFAPGSTLYAQFEVYGAEKEKATSMPKVSAGYVVQRPDGTSLVDVAATRINPTSLGKLSRIVGTRLPPEVTGELELILKFKDEISGKTLEVKEPFTVAPLSAAAGAPAGGPGE